MKPSIKVPSVGEIMSRIVDNLPYDLQDAARRADSNIHGLVHAIAVAQEETLVMVRESFEVAMADREEAPAKCKLQRKGAFWEL